MRGVVTLRLMERHSCHGSERALSSHETHTQPPLDAARPLCPRHHRASRPGSPQTGPFTRAGKILQTDPAIANGPGHHSVVQIPGTDDWYIVYHRHPLDTKGANQRVMAIDRLTFDKEGNIEPIRMTKDGPGARPLPKTR